MNHKMNRKTVAASVTTGLVLALSLTLSHANEQLAAPAGKSSEARTTQTGAPVTGPGSRAPARAEVIGFGEYDPSQPSTPGATGTTQARMLPDRTVAYDGFTETDPSAHAALAGATLPYPVLTQLEAVKTDQAARPRPMAGGCPEQDVSTAQDQR